MKLLIIIFFALGAKGWSATPLDITNVEGKGGNRKILEHPLTENDVTYTESNNENDRIPQDAAKIKFNLQGKNRPDRSGKNLVQLKKGEYVRILKPSKDKRWAAIQILRGSRAKAWVPNNALDIPKISTEAPKKKALPEDASQAVLGE